MKLLRLVVVTCCLTVTAPLGAQDAVAVWKDLQQLTFDPEKTANVSNIALVRDRMRLTLSDGMIQFSRPLEGVVFGAAFRGRGRVQIAPPNATEAQQLRLFTGQDNLDMEFTEAAFSFTDKTFEEIAGQVRWTSTASLDLGELYSSRQKEREDVGAEILPRLFKGLLSRDPARTALFVADLKSKDKGWIHIRFDALQPEEISVGRWKDWGGAKLFDTWLSFPARDRSASDAFRDPMAKEDFQIASYRINAEVTGGAELHATTQVTVKHRAAGERVLVFLLDSNLRLESVTDAASNALPFVQPPDPKDRNQSYGDYVAVVLPEPTTAEQSQTLEFRYGGKRVIRKVGAGNYFCQSYGWYPTRPTSFSTRANFEITFHSPKKYTLVATGNKVSETVDGDTTISTWKSDLPLAVAGFAFGDYKLHTEKAGSIDVEIYANREPDDFMRSVQAQFEGLTPGPGPGPTPGPGPSPSGPSSTPYGLPPLGTLSPAGLVKTMGTEVANMLRLFEKYFGPYPYKRLAVTNIPYSYGQGWPTLLYLSALSFLDSTQRNALGLRDHIGLSDFFRAHETSHQWWGHRVGWKSYHDQWLSEGFAEFSGDLYVQFRESDKEYLNRIRREKEILFSRDQRNRVYESLGPIWLGIRLASSDSPRAYAVVVYSKGGLVLHMLRMMLMDPRSQNPDGRFIAMMQDFCQTFHNKPASTEDFKAIVEKYMTPSMNLDGNRRMDWFFRQYVYGTGVPEYQFRYEVQEAGEGKWRVSGTVLQSGVPAGWKDILPVYALRSGGTMRLGWITVTEKEAPFEVTLPFQPEKLSLNSNEDVLAVIKQ